MNGFTVYPAIDIRAGRVVRLQQGDYDRETRYPDEPLDVARRYTDGGATWLHVVDLDAARGGGYTLAPLLRRLRRETGLRVQTGGGVRSRRDVEEILEAGAERVVVGSLAVREPGTVLDWLARFGRDRITVALDARLDDAGTWRLPTAGWTQDSGVELHALLARYVANGLSHLLCTDIDRDGMLAGPNLALYAAIARQAPQVRVQASGGVRDGADVAAARAAGCAGVVLGKALLDGRMAVADALAAREAAPC